MKTLQRLRRVFRPPLLKRLNFIILNYVKNHRLGKSLQQFSISHRLTEPVPRSFDHGVAVVTPCFNHGAYLESAITSVANQTYRPLQLVLVDDCSTDGSHAIMQRLVEQLPAGITSLILKTPRNSGQAVAMNLGISRSSASVIVTLDADDCLVRDAIETAIEILEKYRNIVLLGGQAISFSGLGLPENWHHFTIKERIPNPVSNPVRLYESDEVLLVREQNDINIGHAGTVFFKSAWDAVGGYYPNLFMRVSVHTDRDFVLRVGSILPIAQCHDIPFCFVRSGSSTQFGGGDSAELWSPRSLFSNRQG